ncbi:porin [Psychrobacter sp. FDAARGOS_221]|uniref:porin n=1 Tax=Psychrobacter sp. FDAARGOS_221 TaxID=1975705 RepID=UPI000BB58749|nr:porin [Psychrobacter sp. FDAARGOS_221]PNK60023.1 porin [Psychrobacter sp. FDAARGOS_221]
MKKLLLASAIAALSVPAAQAAPTFYGKLFMTVDYVDEEADRAYYWHEQDGFKETGGKYDENGTQINSNGSRLGIKGSEPLSANTDVIYQLEYGVDVDADDHNSFRNRDTFLGIKNATFGEFRAGHNQSTTDYINNVIVNEGYWDNLGSTKLDGEQNAAALNMADSGRVSNSLVWKAPQIDGVPLQFAAMYANDDDIKGENDGGWGASLMFDQGTGYTVGIAYDDDVNIAGDLIRGTATVDLGAMNAGVPVTLGALYQQADYDWAGSKKEKGYIVSASMDLTNFTKPAMIYAQYNNTSNLGGVDNFDSDQIVVGGKYFYRKNVIAHAYIGQNKADNMVLEVTDDGQTYTGNFGDGKVFAVGAGLEYKF